MMLSTSCPIILMYHSIGNNVYDPLTVPIKIFEEQVSWLLENGFESVSLAFVVQTIEKRDYKSLHRKVVFTFDDGYDDFVGNALPVLLRYGVTATVFVVTGMLGEKASWSKYSADARLMTEEEARYVKSQGMDLGSHTVTHALLTTLDQGELNRQINDSYVKLAELGETFYAFSYPWGLRSPEVLKAVRAAGYQCAVTADDPRWFDLSDLHCLPRIEVPSDADLRSFQEVCGRASLTLTFQKYYRALKRCLRNEQYDSNRDYA